MRPLSPIAWYSLLVVRYGLALALGWLCVRYIWALHMSFALKVIAEFVVVNGVIVGALVVGPLSYGGYLAEQRRLEEARARKLGAGGSG